MSVTLNPLTDRNKMISNKKIQTPLIKEILKNKALYIMLIPGFAFYLLFKYTPLLGSIIAFKDYNIFLGITKSPWVGFKWFSRLFQTDAFWSLLVNTLSISFYQIIFSFPLPIILALLMNEIRNMMFKKTIQTVIYLPHFLSWSIVAGLAYALLSSQVGIVNHLLLYMGLVNEPIDFLQNSRYTRTIIVVAGMWKEAGWNTIIFLATLTGINPGLYEAAQIDGASRWKQCFYITLPGLMPAIVTLLLLKVGNIMDLGFEAVYPFVNPITASKGDVFDTYTYVVGVIGGQYSVTTAIGLFKSVVGFILLIVCNKVSKAALGEGII